MRVLQTLALPLGHVALPFRPLPEVSRMGRKGESGAGNGIRTRDPNLGKVVLYH